MSLLACCPPKLNPQWRITDVTDAFESRALLTHANHQTEPLTIPLWLKQAFDLFEQYDNWEDIRIAYQQMPGSPHWERFLLLIEQFCIPKHILLTNEQPQSAPQRPAKGSSTLLAQKVIMGANTVESCTKVLSKLINAKAGVVVSVLFALSLLLWLINTPHTSGLRIEQMSLVQTCLAVVLTLFGALWHELGHASAAKRFGCANSPIGVGWYLVFPVFFTQLTETWSLAKYQRVIVDLGGLYFQAIYLIALMLAGWWMPAPSIQIATVFFLITFAINLNPFFKFDGYWICNDLLGRKNLKQAANEQLIMFANVISGIGTSGKFNRLVLGYALANALFFCALVGVIFYRLSTLLVPQLFTHASQLAVSQTITAQVASTVLSALWNLALIALCVYLVTVTLRKFLAFMREYVSQRYNAPVRQPPQN